MIIPFLTNLISNNIFRVLLVTILMDVIFGVLRAIREHKTNSAIGIDGIIRKVAMLFSMVFLSIIDYIMQIDLLSFIPESLKEFINLQNVGVSNLFILLFIVFEALSVLKNMTRCRLPIPKKLHDLLKKLLTEFTEEVKEGEK